MQYQICDLPCAQQARQRRGSRSRVRRQLPGRKLLIIWDRLQAHRSRLVRDYVDTEGGDIQLEFLPPYAPELNPVEYLWALSLFINDQ